MREKKLKRSLVKKLVSVTMALAMVLFTMTPQIAYAKEEDPTTAGTGYVYEKNYSPLQFRDVQRPRGDAKAVGDEQYFRGCKAVYTDDWSPLDREYVNDDYILRIRKNGSKDAIVLYTADGEFVKIVQASITVRFFGVDSDSNGYIFINSSAGLGSVISLDMPLEEGSSGTFIVTGMGGSIADLTEESFGGKKHKCVVEEQRGQAATCTEDGYKAYYQCTDEKCGKIYVSSDMSGDSYENLDAWKASEAGKIDATGHTYGELAEAKAATCVEEGNVAYKVCSDCKKYFDEDGNILETIVVDIDPDNHNLGSLVEANEATCVEEGNVAYKVCSDCKKYFDEDGNILDAIVVDIDSDNHSFGELVPAKEPTCKEVGNVAYKVCEYCEKEFDEKGNVLETIEVDINPDNHHPAEKVIKNIVEATTTVPSSYDEVVCCKDCNKELSRKTVTGEVIKKDVHVEYTTHIQGKGWHSNVSDGKVAGTTGEGKRIEAIKINVKGNEDVGIAYTTHVQSVGWLPWSKAGETSGTTGESKRMEAIKIQLTGKDAALYDVYYRVHVQSYGWMAWAKNGEIAGTTNLSKRMEAVQVVVVYKGTKISSDLGDIKSATEKAYMTGNSTGAVTGDTSKYEADKPNVVYKSHVQSLGWQNWKSNGAVSGTTGLLKRLEAIQIRLTNCPYSGGIQYKSHVQSYGWEKSWSANGALSGTTGRGKRIEAVQIELTGEMANHYDVYYRVHSQSYGWMAWAKNGESAGTEGLSKRVEGIQIVLVEKGGKAPANNYGGITSKSGKAFIK